MHMSGPSAGEVVAMLVALATQVLVVLMFVDWVRGYWWAMYP